MTTRKKKVQISVYLDPDVMRMRPLRRAARTAPVHDRGSRDRIVPDRVSRKRPIALRAGGHITVLNSKALEVAGIDRNFQPPAHSVTGQPEVVRDSHGDPTGIVKEMDSLLPLPSPDADQLREAIESGLHRYFTTNGVTTIGEISETVLGIECMNDLAG